MADSRYGRSPAMECLDAARTENELTRRDLQDMWRGGPEGEAAQRRLFARKRAAMVPILLELGIDAERLARLVAEANL